MVSLSFFFFFLFEVIFQSVTRLSQSPGSCCVHQFLSWSVLGTKWAMLETPHPCPGSWPERLGTGWPAGWSASVLLPLVSRSPGAGPWPCLHSPEPSGVGGKADTHPSGHKRGAALMGGAGREGGCLGGCHPRVFIF